MIPRACRPRAAAFSSSTPRPSRPLRPCSRIPPLPQDRRPLTARACVSGDCFAPAFCWTSWAGCSNCAKCRLASRLRAAARRPRRTGGACSWRRSGGVVSHSQRRAEEADSRRSDARRACALNHNCVGGAGSRLSADSDFIRSADASPCSLLVSSLHPQRTKTRCCSGWPASRRSVRPTPAVSWPRRTQH